MRQVSDGSQITRMVAAVLAEQEKELQAYLCGKETLANWFFGQVMRAAQGQANPQLLREELHKQLEQHKQTPG